MTDLTGFELYTRDKSSTIYYPIDLSKIPEGAQVRITITKDKFKASEEGKAELGVAGLVAPEALDYVLPIALILFSSAMILYAYRVFRGPQYLT